MNMYIVVGDRVGTPESRELAQQLVHWHDAMVKHVRLITHHGRRCLDGCPHEEARTLWSAALDVFGDHAGALTFLQHHGGARSHHAGAAGAELYA
jgi:hypothetical protein